MSNEVAVRRPQAVSTLPTEVEWNIIQAQAQAISSAGIVPQAYRKQPANVIVAALTGRPFGWDPLTAVRNITVIQGTATIKPEAMLGLIRNAGHSVKGEATATSATVTGKRRDTGDEMTFTWTIEMARRAGLATKDNWKNYPESMLWARAVAQLGRMLFPDVLMGLSYTADEIGAVTDQEGNILEDVPTRVAAAHAQPVSSVPMLTQAQRAELGRLYGSIGWDVPTLQRSLGGFGARRVDDLTETNAEQLIEVMASVERGQKAQAGEDVVDADELDAWGNPIVKGDDTDEVAA